MPPSVHDGYLERCATWSDIQEYLPLLYGYVRLYEGCRVLEVGTRDGNSTLAFLAAAQVTGGHVWSVDSDAEVPTRADGMGPYADCPDWTFICGDSTAPGVLAQVPGQVDIVFNDAGHMYEKTLEEIRAYMPLLAPGGTALFHDTRLGWDNHGVKRALNVYCAQNSLTWRDLPGQFGLGVITLDRVEP
jgi:predicted O-methyltransferase YrrM